ncbi:3-hydroxyacyl-[acyl-carrier-protein] dehydratase [Christiangramia gaetbulicola]|uniref:3-hydroxyacyl-[acyl-carrier-protein] dehydratase n=1 Tax=Christiangramia gaetbulicola TaxID=703340 RepID=A0A2T6AH10_9FLAO|nr:FabA/FabZ family ACP-dehydratase [Christiangramia gaetbulicola]PTX43085.1 3-hydroxyacyl-[acyl-carrier-protein] dehydratase [Christiangramia gaetbulicola]
MQEILAQLPYSSPFLFVDEILNVDSDSIEGKFTFSPDLDFYKGHFKDNPVTPGVILTECMAQIGVVGLGIYLLNQEKKDDLKAKIAMTSSEVEYLKPVYPGETVTVHSEKQYYRFEKLKCRVKMFDSENNLVCRGVIAGMILKDRS